MYVLHIALYCFFFDRAATALLLFRSCVKKENTVPRRTSAPLKTHNLYY